MNISQKHSREGNILARASEHPIMRIATEHGAFLAGGAVRSVFASEKISDFDIFFPSEKAFSDCIAEIAGELDSNDDLKYNFTKTDSAWSHFSDKKQHFQLICAVFGTPEEILSKFDFTVCMGVWIPSTSNFILDDLFLKHIAQKRLCYNIGSDYPICSLWRVIKYTKKGYKLPAIDSIKLALKIHSLKITTQAEFKKQLMGIDTMFLMELTTALGELNEEARYDFGEAITMISKFLEEKESENINE